MEKKIKRFITSDPHYGHTNICRGTTTWRLDASGLRDFDTVEEMNDAIVKSINDVVGEDDEMYMLGDWAFGGIANVVTFRKRIHCKNIFFIPGNHDTNVKKNRLHNGAPLQDLFIMRPVITNIIHNNVQFIMSHYPLEQWENMENGAIHLHGHVHHEFDNTVNNIIFKRKDVGWEGSIYDLDDIILEMSERKNKKQYDCNLTIKDRLKIFFKKYL